MTRRKIGISGFDLCKKLELNNCEPNPSVASPDNRQNLIQLRLRFFSAVVVFA